MNLSVVYIPIALSLSMQSLSSAQVAGVPTLPRFLIFSKAAIAVDGGLTGGNSGVVGTAATALFGPLVVSAAGSVVLPKETHSFGSYGATVDVFQWMHLGVAHWDSAGVSHLHVPLGLTLPFAWCLRSDRAWLVWVGGRRDFQRVAPRSQSAYSNDAWAYTVGLFVETSARFGFQVAGDRTSRSKDDWSLSAGMHVALRTLPKGTRTVFFSPGSSDFKSDPPCGSLPGELAGH